MVADERPAGDELPVVLDGPGTGEEEARGVAGGLVERHGPQVVEPVEDLAAGPLVVGVVAAVVEEFHVASAPTAPCGQSVLFFPGGTNPKGVNHSGPRPVREDRRRRAQARPAARHCPLVAPEERPMSTLPYKLLPPSQGVGFCSKVWLR